MALANGAGLSSLQAVGKPAGAQCRQVSPTPHWAFLPPLIKLSNIQNGGSGWVSV